MRTRILIGRAAGATLAGLLASVVTPQPLRAQTTVFSDGFGTDTGWVTNPLGSDTATTGQWQRGNPAGTSSGGLALQLDPCAGGTANCLVTGLAAGTSVGANDVDGGITRIESPPISLPASAGATLSFAFYFAHLNNSAPDDFFRVRVVRPDGTTVIVFQELGTAANDGAAFTPQSVDLGAFAGQTIRIRFEAADNAGGSLVEAAVDDVTVVATPAGTPVVQVFQHCDFGGWQADFGGTGSFSAADLVSRGGVNNDASSVKVASGFKVTLFDDDNQTGGSVVLTAGETACLVGFGFNDVLSSLRIETDTAAPIVQVFQHCDFTGWRADFGSTGSFSTADLVSRGGVDNDASSVKVASGFKVTLFDGDNQTGASVVLTAGDTACLVNNSFNDVLSSLRVETDAGGVGCGSPDVPATLTDPIGGHGLTMSCVAADDQVALYGDADFVNLGGARTAWVLPFASEAWEFIRDNYGTCARQPPPPLGAPIAPGCERFGTIPLRMTFHQNRFFGGTLANRFDSFTGFRNVIDVGDNGWNESNAVLHDEIVHEMCHHVEGDSQGIHESPAFGVIWGDSKWAEFCMYDFYVRSGRTAFAQRVFDDFMDNRDNLPQGSTGSAWFRDWFFPLWDENGGNARVMERFFELLAQHFPKHLENANRNLIYDRRMNPGEYVHFQSAAAGRDLSGRADAAFNGFDRNQFLQARQTFPALNSLYVLE